MHEQPDVSLPPSTYGRDAGFALFFVSLVSFLNFFDRVLATVIAEPIKGEFSLSDTQLGFLTGPALVLIIR
jgi:hypothetical protein